MSTTIDQKVVEMRFDNQHFEKNVSTTMSTLDKLKHKLKFGDASKGLDELNKSAKNVDMNGLASGVETVRSRFSALEVMGVTALANITNSAVNAGKKMISALTIDPIKTGFQEYETQINAVQTILANTSSKGTTIDQVNEALEELNKYADMTIYNFTEMTRNIGTFTAAGVDLDTSVSAIQGIANLAAVSGSTSQQASTAMYQLSQALAAGTVKLQDWNSVVNAGMGGEVFQNALKRTAKVMGTDVDALIKKYGSFRESLSKGEWLTTEVLTKTLNQFTMAAKEGTEQWKSYKKALMDDGYTEEQANEILKMANTATDAATKVKTFTQLWDVLKESAQSGWSQTWKLIIGDFEQAKGLLTPLADFLTGAINKFSDARNKLLESALGKSFKGLSRRITKFFGPIKETADGIKEVVDAVQDYSKVVDEIIRGKWGNGPKRWEDLTKAGYDWAHAQNLVNEKLGNAKRHMTNYVEGQESMVDAQGKTTEAQKGTAKSTAELIAELVKYSDAELKAMGYTDHHIKILREVESLSDKTGISIKELVENMDQIDGRYLLINSFKNAGKGLVSVFKALGEAWKNAFPPMTTDQLFNIIAGLHKFSTYLVMSEETAGKLTRTFKGLFAILDIIATLAGSIFKIGFKIFTEFLKALGYMATDVLSITAVIGDAVVAFRDWLEKHNLINRAIETLVPLVVNAGKAIIGMIRSFIELPAVQFAIESICYAFGELAKLFEGPLQTVDSVIKSLGSLENVTLGDIVQSLATVKESIESSFSQWLADHPKVVQVANIIKESFITLGNVLKSSFDGWLSKHPELKTALTSLQKLFGGFGTHTIEMFRNIGSVVQDTLWNFLNMESFDFSDINNVLKTISTTIKAEFSKWLSNFPTVQKAFNDIRKAFSIFGGVVSSVMKNISGPISKAIGYLKSLDSITLDGLKEALRMVAVGIYQAFTGSEEIPADIVDGLVIGLRAGLGRIIEAAKELASSIIVAIKEMLGIHSPSTVMQGVGGNIIDGLVDGIKNGLSKVIETCKGLASGIADIIGRIDWGAVFAVGVTSGMLFFIKKISDAFGMLASPLEGLGEMLAGAGKVMSKAAVGIKKVLKGFAKVLNSFAFSVKAKALKNIAISLAILVGSVLLLTLVDTTKLWNAVAIVGVLAVILAALAAATNLMSKSAMTIGKDGVAMDRVSIGLTSIGLTLLLLAATVKIMGSLNVDQAKQGFLGLAGLVTAIAVVFAAYGLLVKGKSAQNVDKVGKMMIKLSLSLLLMTVVLKLVNKLSPEEMLRGAAFVAGFAIFVAALVAVTKSTSRNIDKLSFSLIKIVLAMKLMVGLFKLVDLLTVGEAIKGAAFVAAFVLFVKGLVKATQVGKETQIAKLSGLLLSVSTSMILMVGVLKLVGTLTGEEMIKGAAFIAGFTLFIKGLLNILTVGKEQQIAKVGGTILAMSVAIGIMAGVAIILGLIDLGGLAKGLVAVGLLSLMMTGMIKATRGATDIKSSILMMAVTIGILALAVAALSFIPVEKLAGATIAMSTLMGMFALMIKATGHAQKAMGTLIVLTITVAALAGVLWLLSKLEVEASIANAASLGILMLAVSGAMLILSKMSMTIKNALVGAIALTSLAIPMLAFIGVLAVMNLVENATANAKALSGLMVVMSLVLAALTIIGHFWVGAAAGIIALTAMAIPMLAFVGVLALMNKIQNATSNAELLTGLMTTMTKILVALAIVGPLAIVGLGAMQGLILLMGEIAVMAAIIGGLVEKFPSLQTFLDTGLPLLERLATSIGTMLGNFVAGFATTISGALPQIGTDLSAFMTNVTPFIEGAKLIDETAVTGVKCLASALIALTGAELINSIASFISGGVTLADLGTDLSAFMTNASPFIEGVKVIDPSVVEGAKALAETILILTGANILEGIAGFITGESSLSEFGSELSGLGTHLNSFVTNLGTFDETKANSVSMAANAIKTLAEAASTLPNNGGWAGKILGENSLSDFGYKLPQLGTNIALFANNLGTFSDDQTKTIKCAANAIKAIAEAAVNIPNEGGWAAKIFGENSIAAFASNLPGLGTNLASFATNLGSFGSDKVATVKCAGDAIVAMADAASNIDGQAEWAAKIFGDNSLSTFSGQFGTLGTNIAAFATNLGTFGEDKVTTVNTAVRAIKALGGLADANLEVAKNNMNGFGSTLGTFGKNVAAMCTALPSSDTVASAATVIKNVISLINDVAAADAEGAANFTKSLKTIGDKGVSTFINAFSSGQTSVNVKKAGTTLMINLISGIKSKITELTNTFKNVTSGAVNAIKDYYDDFSSAGSYLVDGFAAGISENTFKAAAKASAMAKAAVQAAKKELDINSPSKVFRALGYSVPEGFAMGIERLAYVVTNSSVGMADAAFDGVKGAMARIKDSINNDIDAQPVIRPVLDLSNVHSGAGAINGLFGGNRSLGLMANVGSISSMMAMNQNGVNSDVVSAIDKLRADLGSVRGDTYQINGVTYDDGSNITSAVKTLVQAAKVERRI